MCQFETMNYGEAMQLTAPETRAFFVQQHGHNSLCGAWTQ